MNTLEAFDTALARLHQREAVLVQVAQTQGSTPREPGAWMLVWPNACAGSIGGGALEHQAMHEARALLASPANAPAPPMQRQALGPSLGQCCGGVVQLRFERVGPADVPALRQRLAPSLHPVALFGGGHVGHALVRLLTTLPFALHWIDSRANVFDPKLPAWVRTEHSDPVQAAVSGLTPGARVLVMSFSHAEDLDILIACLERQRARGDLPFIGLIGSRSKWARFRRRLAARGFGAEEIEHITCPIGVPGIVGKQPEVIAVAVAAQLLQQTTS